MAGNKGEGGKPRVDRLVDVVDTLGRPYMIGVCGAPGSGKSIMFSSFLEWLVQEGWTVWMIDFKGGEDTFHMFPQGNPKLKRLLRKVGKQPRGFPTNIYIPPLWDRYERVYSIAKPISLPLRLIEHQGVSKLLERIFKPDIVSLMKDTLLIPSAQDDIESFLMNFNRLAERRNIRLHHDVHRFIVSGLFTPGEPELPLEPGMFHVFLPLYCNDINVAYLWLYGILTILHSRLLNWDRYPEVHSRKIIIHTRELSMLAPMNVDKLTYYTTQALHLMGQQLRNIRDTVLRISYEIQNYTSINKMIRGLTQIWFFGRQSQSEARKIREDFGIQEDELVSLEPGEFIICYKNKVIRRRIAPCLSFTSWEPEDKREEELLAKLINRYMDRIGYVDVEDKKRVIEASLYRLRVGDLEEKAGKTAVEFNKYSRFLIPSETLAWRLLLFAACTDVFGSNITIPEILLQKLKTPLMYAIAVAKGDMKFGRFNAHRYIETLRNQLLRNRYPDVFAFLGIGISKGDGVSRFNIHLSETFKMNIPAILDYAKRSIKITNPKLQESAGQLTPEDFLNKAYKVLIKELENITQRFPTTTTRINLVSQNGS